MSRQRRHGWRRETRLLDGDARALLAFLERCGALALVRTARVHIVELGARLALLLVVVSVLGHLALLVERLVPRELLLLGVELREPRLDRGEHLGDFVSTVGRILHDAEALVPPLVVRLRARNLLEQLETLLVLHRRQQVHLALRHNVVRVRAREACALEQVDHLSLGHVLAVEEVSARRGRDKLMHRERSDGRTRTDRIGWTHTNREGTANFQGGRCERMAVYAAAAPRISVAMRTVRLRAQCELGVGEQQNGSRMRAAVGSGGEQRTRLS